MSHRTMSDVDRKAYLMRELIYQALRDVVSGYEDATDEERAMSHRFIFDDSHGVGSFLWCCEKAGLEPAEVRAEVTKRDSCALSGAETTTK